MALESGQWKFAKRTVQLDGTTSLAGEFGLAYVFDKPTDFVRTIGIWSDEMLTNPMGEACREEAGHWFADQETIYLSYVSNDAAYGLDYSLWPQSFVKFVQAHFAAEMAGPLSSKGPEAMKVRKMFLSEALATDAMADPTRTVPAGSWVRARMRGGIRRDGQP